MFRSAIFLFLLGLPAATQAQLPPEIILPWDGPVIEESEPEFDLRSPVNPERRFKPASQVDIVLRWNEATLNTIRAEKSPPPVAARNLAIVHIAIYDAVNAVVRSHPSFHAKITAPTDTSIEAAATVAGYQALAGVYPQHITRFNEILDRTLAAIPDGSAKSNGVELGRKVAAKVLAWRKDDMKSKKSSYSSKSELGRWQPTPPDFTAPLLPEWASTPGFGIRSAADFHPVGPADLKSEQFVQAYREVKTLGGSKSAMRTKDQSEIARFWADGAGSVTPPGHWNRIARTVAEDRNQSLADNARLFAMLNVALADAGIVCWDCKFKFDFWRPVAAIRRADLLNNPNLESDSQWSSFLPTPPFPAYPSGHSTFSSAGAAILENFFKTDDIRFTSTSDDLPGVKRSYRSFSQAANEAGMSRIYGGIHWQFDNEQGLICGKKVAKEISRLFLKPKASVEESSRDSSYPPDR